jgi:hypothetical protein
MKRWTKQARLIAKRTTAVMTIHHRTGAIAMEMETVIATPDVGQDATKGRKDVMLMAIRVLTMSQPDNESKRTKEVKALERSTYWMKPEKYDGKTCWRTYLNHFKVCAQHNGWDDDEKTAYVRWAMAEQAAQLLWRTKGFTYERLFKKLEQHFGSDRSQEKFQHELRCRRRGEHETLPELAQDVQRLMSLAYPEDNDSTTARHVERDAFLSAMDDADLELKVLEREPKDLDCALEIAQRVEAVQMKVSITSGSYHKINRNTNQNLTMIEGQKMAGVTTVQIETTTVQTPTRKEAVRSIEVIGYNKEELRRKWMRYVKNMKQW